MSCQSPDKLPSLHQENICFGLGSCRGIGRYCSTPYSTTKSMQPRVTSKSKSWPFGLMLMRQISSLAQDSFNAACEFYQLIAVLFNNIQADCSSLGVTQWGYGHHNRDLPVNIRSSPEPLKVSHSCQQCSCKDLKLSSFSG